MISSSLCAVVPACGASGTLKEHDPGFCDNVKSRACQYSELFKCVRCDACLQHLGDLEQNIRVEHCDIDDSLTFGSCFFKSGAVVCACGALETSKTGLLGLWEPPGRSWGNQGSRPKVHALY